MGAGGGSERGEKMPHVHVEALPGWACSRASGRGSSKGGGAPAPWTTRETAEAAEAEAVRHDGPTPSLLNTREGKGACILPAEARGKEVKKRCQSTS
jgi:hypothetical protein